MAEILIWLTVHHNSMGIKSPTPLKLTTLSKCDVRWKQRFVDKHFLRAMWRDQNMNSQWTCSKAESFCKFLADWFWPQYRPNYYCRRKKGLSRFFFWPALQTGCLSMQSSHTDWWQIAKLKGFKCLEGVAIETKHDTNPSGIQFSWKLTLDADSDAGRIDGNRRGLQICITVTPRS